MMPQVNPPPAVIVVNRSSPGTRIGRLYDPCVTPGPNCDSICPQHIPVPSEATTPQTWDAPALICEKAMSVATTVGVGPVTQPARSPQQYARPSVARPQTNAEPPVSSAN